MARPQQPRKARLMTVRVGREIASAARLQQFWNGEVGCEYLDGRPAYNHDAVVANIREVYGIDAVATLRVEGSSIHYVFDDGVAVPVVLRAEEVDTVDTNGG